MKIDCDELGGGGGSYASLGMKNSMDFRKIEWVFGEEEDDFFFFNGMSFSDCEMLYDSAKNRIGVGSLFDCFVGFGEISGKWNTSLPDDPFCMNQIGLLFVSESHDKFNDFEVSLPEDPFCMDWFHENQSDLVLESHDVEPISIIDLDDGEPHEAFELVLPYLEMKDILAVEGVCRSLRDSVRREPFLWRTIDFGDFFFKSRVNDDTLLKLTRRAQGNLQCLNLGGCVGITDYGLMQVLASNPHLTKLRISGCYRLSTAGMLSTLRDLKSSNRLGIKSLITGGALYFTMEEYKELNFLLGADAKPGPKSRKQRFYTSRRSEFALEDDWVTDLEICPRCEKPSLVFDCAAEETCPLKDDDPRTKSSSCRACVVCIERCHDCGGCLNDCERNPFCFAFICVVCYKKRSNQLQVFP